MYTVETYVTNLLIHHHTVSQVVVLLYGVQFLTLISCMCCIRIYGTFIMYIKIIIVFLNQEHYPIMRSFMRLRLALVPYLYTQAHTAYATGWCKMYEWYKYVVLLVCCLVFPKGLSILRGMYYDYPDEGEAYSYMASQVRCGCLLLVVKLRSNTPGGLCCFSGSVFVW